MSKKSRKSQQELKCWAGVDWGHFEHAVKVVDEKRKKVKKFTAKNTLEGLKKLDQQLQKAGNIQGIAIEATSNMVVRFLLSKGYTLYLINPKMSKNWRESNSVSGAKSDARDGHVLAVELARRHESLRPVEPVEPVVAELAGLCETVRDLVDERTALLQQLKAALRAYYPAALDFFSTLTSPVAWRFLQRFPRPEDLARARKQTLCTFLKSNQVGLSPRWLERIEKAREAADWPRPYDSVAYEMRTESIVVRLQALQPKIEKCDRLIAERAQQLPQAELMDSLPGAGARLTPALTAITAIVEHEMDWLNAMRCLSGVAPIEFSSGKRCTARIRLRCNKHWRNVMHLFARMTVKHCEWAHAFYELCREHGDSFATALRKLADKWLKIIHRMLVTNQPYDDQRYVEALRLSGSPVYDRLCGKVGG